MKVSKQVFGMAAAAMFVGAGTVQAASVTPTDFDSLTLGNQVAGPLVTEFDSVHEGVIGGLISSVYDNDGVFTYVFEVTPDRNNISEFNTNFEVLGFNGVAGFSFSDALAIGGDGVASDFLIEHDGDGTLDWHTQLSQISGDDQWFDIGETVSFFFQSTIAPAGRGYVNLTNSAVGTAGTYSVVPTPTAAVVGLPMLGLLGLGRRRRA